MRRAALLPAHAKALFTSTAVAYGSGPQTTRFDITGAYSDESGDRPPPQMFLIPAGRIPARDAGSATFDWDGTVLVLQGPHPLITDGDATVAAICTYLAAA